MEQSCCALLQTEIDDFFFLCMSVFLPMQSPEDLRGLALVQ